MDSVSDGQQLVQRQGLLETERCAFRSAPAITEEVSIPDRLTPYHVSNLIRGVDGAARRPYHR